VAVGSWSLQPSEFWAMTIREWWWLADVRAPSENYGDLSGNTVKDLYEDLKSWRSEKSQDYT
jgi:hypothetical protein